MERCRPLLFGAMLLLVPAILSVSANSDNEKEPSPEPYSFSYNAESIGGFSSHQESGDGSGRVQGFYIIMGEDGRDRRVDYVADENGYRASISTNEVGTRTESSADAQYNARLPSQGQLEQAKVSAEEYQFLEDQHAAERERHLKNASIRQQQQQQFDFNSSMQQLGNINQQQQQQQQQQQFQTSAQANGSRTWSSSTGQPTGWTQQAQNQQFERNNTAASNEQFDDSWRARASAYTTNQSADQQQQQQQQSQPQRQQAQLQRFSSWSNQTSESAQQEPQQAPLNQASPIPLPTTVGPLTTALINAPAPQRQQAQQAAWQLVDRGAAPARVPSGNTYLQRQLEQQFMQQAYQLTDQDYPRQTAQVNRQQSASSEFNGQSQQQEQQQQQQQPFVSFQQPQRITTNGQSRQQSWMIMNNNDRVVSVGSTSGELSQINQQQNNIIDEVSGEQVDTQLGSTASDETNKASGFVGFSSTTPAAPMINQAVAQVKQQSSFAQQRPVFTQPQTTTTITTTTTQPTPTGFIAINLSQENSAQNQQTDQEVESKQPQRNLQVNYPTTLSASVETNDQSVSTQSEGGDFQQVSVQGQQQQQQLEVQKPNSIKQVIEKQQAQQELAVKGIVSTTTPGSRLDVTTQGPELTTGPQRRLQQQGVETSQAPLRPVEIITTTTSTTTTTTPSPTVPTVYQPYTTSTTARPVRVSYETTTAAAVTAPDAGLTSSTYGSLLTSSTLRPIVQSQRVEGVKGGFAANQAKFNFARQQSAFTRLNEGQQTVLMRPVGGAIQSIRYTNSTSLNQPVQTTSALYQQRAQTFTSPRPEPVTANRLVFNQTNNQQVAYQRPRVTLDYSQQRQQQTGEVVEVGTTSTTNAPARYEATNLQQLQRQDQWQGGVKGGSKTGRRQFWLQQQQQPQQPVIPSSQRVFPNNNIGTAAVLSVQQQPTIVQNRASVDYASNSSSYGSRLNGR